MLVDGERVTRLGGTALGGGTLLGLGAALTGVAEFDRLLSLAGDGDRRRVDLLVSDIYRAGDLPLPGDLTAASFGKLADPVRLRPARSARPGPRGDRAGRRERGADLRRARDGGGREAHRLRRQHAARKPGARRDPARLVRRDGPRSTIFLRDGEFAGALGALEIAARR